MFGSSQSDIARIPSRSKSGLRVLHVVEAFGGGVFEVVRTLSGRLAQLDVQTAVAYGARAETPLDVPVLIGSDVELFPLPWTTRSLLAQISAGRALKRLCGQWSPDLVHLHSSFAGLVGALALSGERVPLVYTPHGYSFTMSTAHPALRFGFRLAESYVAGKVDAVGAVSQWEEQLARTHTRAPRTFVVENGIPELDDRSMAEPLPAAPSKLMVMAMGRVCSARRPREVASIFNEVRDLAEVRWVGGAADQRDGDVLTRCDIPMTGWLPRDEAVRQLRGASVYLHWAAWDAGAPLAVLEAMAYDVPVVASDIPPLRGALDDRQLAADVATAAEKIRLILSDPDTRREWQLRQQEQRTRFSADQMARRWQHWYERIAAARRP